MLSQRANERIDGCEYPATCETVQRALGDETLSLPVGSEPAADAVALGGGDVFETAADVRLAVYSGVGGDAVGRRGYSDRDPGTPGTDEPAPLSF